MTVRRVYSNGLLTELQRKKGVTTSAGKIDEELPPDLILRRIDYQAEESGDKIYLYTSLLDEASHPAIELAHLCHKRWRIEIAFDGLETEMILRKEALRTKRPAGVELEI